MRAIDNVQPIEDGPYAGTFGFYCPGVKDSKCGDSAANVPFSSVGWPSAEIAAERGREHFADHKGTPASSLEEFRAKHGLAAVDDGDASIAVTLADLED